MAPDCAKIEPQTSSVLPRITATNWPASSFDVSGGADRESGALDPPRRQEVQGFRTADEVGEQKQDDYRNPAAAAAADA